MMAAAILKNRKIAISPRRMDHFQQNMAWRHALVLQTPSSNKSLPFQLEYLAVYGRASMDVPVGELQSTQHARRTVIGR